MTRSLAVALVASTALAAGCGGSSSADQPPTVEQLLVRFEQAYLAKDAETIVAMCHFPFALDGAAVETPEQLQALLQGGFDGAGTIETAELVDEEIAASEDTVHVTGAFHLVDSNGESSRPIVIVGMRFGQDWRATSFAFDD